MRTPSSPHFTPLSLSAAFNADRASLGGGLLPLTQGVPDWSVSEAFGAQSYRGIPFALGAPGRPNVVLLCRGTNQVDGAVRIELEPLQATYLVFLHAVEDRPVADPPGFSPLGAVASGGRDDGNELGRRVATYTLVYGDGREAETPILRRFAIQQRHITWGASPFAAIPALGPEVFANATEDYLLDRKAGQPYGRSETRHDSGRAVGSENLWLYALPNPEPDTPIHALVLRPGEERSLVYGRTQSVHPAYL